MSKTAEIITISIGEAQSEHMDALVEMFDDLRVFYGYEGDIGAARSFVAACGKFRGTRFFTATRDGNIAGFMHLVLTTAHTNATAQRLYEAHGYVLDRTFRTYNLALVP